MKRTLLPGILVAACLLAGEAGLRPRQSPKDYPSQNVSESVSIGAAVLPEPQVKSGFATDLNKGYMVVEVALYPGADGRIDLKRDDFEVRVGNLAAVHPVSAEAIAASLQRPIEQRKPRNSDVAIYSTASIGYESGNGGYDPVTGRPRGGWTTSTGVGVGVGGQGPMGPPPPASTPRDRGVMISELEDKALPEGAFTAPVAGYLYFPVSRKKRPSTIQLHYFGPKGEMQMIVAVPH